MTPAPSSPVPAVEAERPTWWPEIVETIARRLCSDASKDPDGLTSVVVKSQYGTMDYGKFDRTWKLWAPKAESLLATPTPGRAAEPDTMGEVERLLFDLRAASAEAEVAAVNVHINGETFAELVADLHKADTAVKEAVRTIITERDRAVELADKYKWQVRDTCTRAETAEAQLATLRAAIRDADRTTRSTRSPQVWQVDAGKMEALRTLSNPKADR